jgi:ribosomal protein S18 acetylase RimI-like enzyme
MEHRLAESDTDIQYARVEDISKLSPAIKKRLAKLSHGKRGLMQQYVTDPNKATSVRYPATLAIDMKAKNIVGWTVFMDGEFVRRLHGDTQKLDIFVDPKYRGRGVGKNLMHKTALMAKERGIKNFVVNPHDKASAGLYGSFGAKYSKNAASELPLGTPKADREKLAQNPRQRGVAVSPTHFGADHEKSTAHIPVTPLLKKIKNPETDNDILVKTALKYPKSHPAHQAALASLKEWMSLRDLLSETDTIKDTTYMSGHTYISKEEVKRIYDKMGYDFDFDQFFLGMNTELEHKDVTHGNVVKTAKIAAAHLRENPKYYSLLMKHVEKKKAEQLVGPGGAINAAPKPQDVKKMRTALNREKKHD